MRDPENRRLRLREWFSSRPIPAKEKSYISQLFSGAASFGEKAAIRLEKTFGMPDGYLDVHAGASEPVVETNIQAVIEMMQSTDDRGRQKIRLAAEDALAEHKAHLMKAGIDTGSKIANAVLNMKALSSSPEVFSKKEKKEKP